MRIAVINPPLKAESGRLAVCPGSQALSSTSTLDCPIGLAYACGYLESHGHEVLLVDSCAERIDSEAMLAKVEAFQPGIVVVDATTPRVVEHAHSVARLKSVSSSPLICLVGTHPPALRQEVMAVSEEVDCVAGLEHDHTGFKLDDCLEIARSLGSVADIGRHILGADVLDTDRPRTGDRGTSPIDSEALETLNIMKMAGWRLIIAGLESGKHSQPEVLDSRLSDVEFEHELFSRFRSSNRPAAGSVPWAEEPIVAHKQPSRWSNSLGKRLFDCSMVLFWLPVIVPMFLGIALLVLVTSRGPVLFLQKRVGRGGQQFTIFKFRTMVHTTGKRHQPVTTAGDLRFTSVGPMLRRWKLDEIPQLLNVLLGHMSLVGPRPKVPEHVSYPLKCRPGITGAATIAFAQEEMILERVPKAELHAFYHSVVLPAKRRLDWEYAATATFASDLRLIRDSVLRRWDTSIMERLLHLGAFGVKAAKPVVEVPVPTVEYSPAKSVARSHGGSHPEKIPAERYGAPYLTGSA